MPAKPYGLYCPTSKATEVLMPRWTIQILGELWGGATRFNDIKRGLPGVSPTLLAKRLKEMQETGLVERVEDKATGRIDYIRTQKAADLDDILLALAKWAQAHIEADIALEDRDADLLMWNIRNQFDSDALPPEKTIIRLNFADATSPATTYWVIHNPGDKVEICASDPGFDVDLFIETTVGAFTGVYLGRIPFARAVEDGSLFFSGSALLEKTFLHWFRLSDHAGYDRIAKAG